MLYVARRCFGANNYQIRGPTGKSVGGLRRPLFILHIYMALAPSGTNLKTCLKHAKIHSFIQFILESDTRVTGKWLLCWG